MNYKKYISGKNTKVSVNGKLVEIGDIAWQISNIVATSVKSEPVVVKDPEPRFYEDEPKLNLNIKAMLIVMFVVWAGTGGMTESGTAGLIAAIFVAGVIFFVANSKHETAKNAWQARKDEILRQWQIWDYMRKNPPILHRLMFETNSGSHPVLYSMEEKPIKVVNDAIKKAMNHEVVTAQIFNIENYNEGNINNVGSTIYNQALGDINCSTQP